MFVQKAFINMHFPLWRYSNTITPTITVGVKNQQRVLLSGVFTGDQNAALGQINVP